MKIGRCTLSAASLALLVIQLALVSTFAAKYLYQRWTCPRVWTRAASDPLLPMSGRYLALRLTVDGCQSTLPSARNANFPRDVNGAVTPGPYVLRPQDVIFRANLKVNHNALVAVRVEGSEDSTAGEEVVGTAGSPCDQMQLESHRLLHLRYGAKPVAAQTRPGTLDRSHCTAERRAATHATGAQRQRRVEAAGFEIAASRDDARGGL